MLTTDQALWEELHAGVSRFVRRRVQNHADVQDIVQGVFLRIHKGLGGLKDEARLHAWIYGAARNAIIDHYRRKGRAKESPAGSVDDLPDHADVPGQRDDEHGALSELATCVRPFMGRLSPRDREALQAVEVDGLSQVEAARRLQLSNSGMKSRVQRARRRLKAVFEECCSVNRGRRGEILSYAKRPRRSCDSCSDASPCG